LASFTYPKLVAVVAGMQLEDMGSAPTNIRYHDVKVQMSAYIKARDLSNAEIDGLAVVAEAGEALDTCSCSKLEFMWLFTCRTLVVVVVGM
jgi:hypothetical protein